MSTGSEGLRCTIKCCQLLCTAYLLGNGLCQFGLRAQRLSITVVEEVLRLEVNLYLVLLVCARDHQRINEFQLNFQFLRCKCTDFPSESYVILRTEAIGDHLDLEYVELLPLHVTCLFNNDSISRCFNVFIRRKSATTLRDNDSVLVHRLKLRNHRHFV